MAITLTKKKEILSKLEQSLSGAQSIVFVHFKKLPMAETIALRKQLRDQSVGYVVAKKTLMKRALEAKGFSGEMPELTGEVALAYGADLLAPAREVFMFQKTHKDNIAILGGVFDGKFQTQAEMLSIATIPPLQDLRGMFANIINSPLARFAVVLNEYAKTKN